MAKFGFKTMSVFKTTAFAGGLLLAAIAGTAFAAGSNDYAKYYDMKHPHWHFKGMTGTYDRAAVQRGYQVYREVCASCHTLKHLSFRHLGDKGGPYYDEAYPNPNDNPYVKAFAADWIVADIDAETGDAIDRPATPADYFPPIYANDAAARGSNGGALPPDLSVMVSARTDGANYVYNLLMAYDAKMPEGMKMSSGTYFNPVMEGGAIAMAPPLTDGLLEYAPIMDPKTGESVPAVEATVDQMALDVTEFLAWSSDPKMEVRKQTGLATMLYLLILSILLWVSYQRVWKNVKH